MLKVIDLPQPCWLRYPHLPDLKCLVIAFNEKDNSVVTLNPFRLYGTNPGNGFFGDTLSNHAMHGAQWSADCKTWNNFAQ
jgi:hypothetical protein